LHDPLLPLQDRLDYPQAGVPALGATVGDEERGDVGHLTLASSVKQPRLMLQFRLQQSSQLANPNIAGIADVGAVILQKRKDHKSGKTT
jgi:hypothetical protein